RFIGPRRTADEGRRREPCSAEAQADRSDRGQCGEGEDENRREGPAGPVAGEAEGEGRGETDGSGGDAVSDRLPNVGIRPIPATLLAVATDRLSVFSEIVGNK